MDIRDLTVNINEISRTCEGCIGKDVLLTDSISAFIDSTIPYLYLPLPVCKRFESAFGIEWNESVQGYLVNDTLHEKLTNQNSNVTFTISNSSLGSSAPSVDITLPYAAFDLIAEPPLMRNRSRYFPLMRAANDSQYTLGRTFLQEAYLIADYERREFSVSQCSWTENSPQELIAIQSPDNPAALLGEKHHMSPATIAGTVIGSIMVAVALSLATWIVQVRRRRAKQPLKLKSGESNSEERAETSAELTTTEKAVEVDGASFRGHEIDGVAGHRRPELGDGSVAGQELAAAICSRELEASHAWPTEIGDKVVAACELPA
ncbi:MAG: hypothetical protein LQ350_004972 [Teloschistes chrysophthalmus]|nr:MAG: hypothetical protein LQ350_004972 [Niorma chrysophthalma]